MTEMGAERVDQVSDLHGLGINRLGKFGSLWRDFYVSFNQPTIDRQRNNVSVLWYWPTINTKTQDRTIFACQQKIVFHCLPPH